MGMKDEQEQQLVVPTWRKVVGTILLVLGILFGLGGIGLIYALMEGFSYDSRFGYTALYYQFDFFVAFALLAPFLILLGLLLLSRIPNRIRYRNWLFASRKVYFCVSALLFLYGVIELMCFGTLGTKTREVIWYNDAGLEEFRDWEWYGYGDFPLFFLLALVLGGAGWLLRRVTLKDRPRIAAKLPQNNFALSNFSSPHPSSNMNTKHLETWVFPGDTPTAPSDNGDSSRGNAQTMSIPIRPKSRLAYVLLAFPFFFLGLFGFHNFYALRIKSAVAQLLITILSLGFLSPICFIWALVEICLVSRDGRGLKMQ